LHLPNGKSHLREENTLSPQGNRLTQTRKGAFHPLRAEVLVTTKYTKHTEKRPFNAEARNRRGSQRMTAASWFPPFDFQDAAETDSVITTPAFAVFSDAKKLHEHFRGFGGVTVSELNYVVGPAFEPLLPIGRSLSILDTLGPGRDGGEVLPVKIQVQNAFHNSPLKARSPATSKPGEDWRMAGSKASKLVAPQSDAGGSAAACPVFFTVVSVPPRRDAFSASTSACNASSSATIRN
jgi:hypothetical protein